MNLELGEIHGVFQIGIHGILDLRERNPDPVADRQGILDDAGIADPIHGGCRWGGEEFILICPQIPQARLQDLAEKLRSTIEQQDFEIRGQSLRITVSVGATIVDSKEPFEEVFKRADTALYQAKNQGRNQVRFEAK